MLHREQLIQKESIHPVLHATLQRSDGQTDLLVLVVRNSGKGLAKNVRFEAEPLPDHLPSKLVADAVMRLEMFSGGVDMLASGRIVWRRVCKHIGAGCRIAGSDIWRCVETEGHL